MNYIISFPRSGQHMIESILRYIYLKLDMEFKYCEFYSCCRQISTCKKKSNFKKNHDFWLDKRNKYEPEKILINEIDKYLVLYRRDKIKQLESYYRFYLKSYNKKYDYNELISFLNGSSQYYDFFIDKWINNTYDNILKVEYYDFVDNPNYFIEKIYYHFNSKEVNHELFNIKNLDFIIDNGRRKKETVKKIKIINNIDENLYKKIKDELKW